MFTYWRDLSKPGSRVLHNTNEYVNAIKILVVNRSRPVRLLGDALGAEAEINNLVLHARRADAGVHVQAVVVGVQPGLAITLRWPSSRTNAFVSVSCSWSWTPHTGRLA